jgi:hypothetical protein
MNTPASVRWIRAMRMQGWRENGANLRKKLGLDNQRRTGGEVALAENLEVAVSGDVDDRDLVLGEGL